jgi:opacity protein-like surface antigen
MPRCPVRVLGFCLAALSVANPVSAQTSPRTEISGGYQFLTFSVDDDNVLPGDDNSESLPLGWYFDVAGNLNPLIGVVFQVGGNYKTFEESIAIGGGTFTATADLDVYQFLGGMRLSARDNPRLVPYGQLLVGGVNGSIEVTTSSTIPGLPSFSEEESTTNFALELGGGVNFGVAENIGIRFGVDYLRVFAEDAGSNVFRVHAGVVIAR